MALSDEDRKELKDFREDVVRAVRDLLADGCVCGLKTGEHEEMGHLFGRLKDLGKGNLNSGIERFSKGVDMMLKLQRRGERIGSAVTIFVVLGLAGSLGTAFVIGVKQIIARIGTGGTP